MTEQLNNPPDETTPERGPDVERHDDILTKTTLWQDIRDALKGKPRDYTKGSLWRAIAALSVPMVLEMMMQSVFEVADIFFVGKLGSEAVAAVGLTASLIIIVFAIGLGLSLAASAMVARRIGEKDPEGATRAAWQAIVLTIAFAIPSGLVGAWYASDLLGLMGATDAVREIGTGYAAVMIGSNLVILLLFLFNAIFRGAGDAGAAMKALWLANILNIILDPIFIFGWGPVPEMGVTGAAVATAIGRGIGVAYQVWLLTSGRTRVRLMRKHMHIDRSVQRTMIKISGPGMLQYLVGTASWLAVMRLMADFGSDALAGYTVAIRVIIFALLPSWGISNAAATLVGQNLGAKQPDRAERSVWYCTWLDVAFLSLLGLIFWIYAPETVAFFVDSPGARAVGIQSMRILTVIYPVWAIGMVTVQAFNGAGDTWTPTWIHFFSFWVLQLPLAWFLAHPMELGTQGVFLAVAVAQVIAAAVSGWLFRGGRWKNVQV